MARAPYGLVSNHLVSTCHLLRRDWLHADRRFILTICNISRRDSLRTIAVLGAAATAGVAGLLTAEPAKALQPFMHGALISLQSALTALQNAEADNGGHRAAAIGYLNQAIVEVQVDIAAGGV